MTDADISNIERFEAAVAAMTLDDSHYDVTIVCTTDDYQAEFWMSKLKTSSSSGDGESGPFPLVVAVSEDWTDPSGAGNGLGTLYAWQKACLYAQEHFQVDLATQLSDGSISAALYHTAGKGTRLAPLPASENNNKPGVVRKLYVLCFLHPISFVASPTVLGKAPLAVFARLNILMLHMYDLSFRLPISHRIASLSMPLPFSSLLQCRRNCPFPKP